MAKTHLDEYGWVDVPRNRTNIPSEQQASTTNVEIDGMVYEYKFGFLTLKIILFDS